MVFGKLKDRKKDSGFTLVELLIVIVVIAILAAITIVAYGNISARANTTQGSTAAANAVKVAEAYNADGSTYPISIANFQSGYITGGATPSTKLPSGITIQSPGTAITAGTVAAPTTGAPFSAKPASGNVVSVLLHCPSTGVSDGGAVYWYDFQTASTIHVLTYGSVSSTATIDATYKGVGTGC